MYDRNVNRKIFKKNCNPNPDWCVGIWFVIRRIKKQLFFWGYEQEYFGVVLFLRMRLKWWKF
jgi:hypothetical protein